MKHHCITIEKFYRENLPSVLGNSINSITFEIDFTYGDKSKIIEVTSLRAIYINTYPVGSHNNLNIMQYATLYNYYNSHVFILERVCKNHLSQLGVIL